MAWEPILFRARESTDVELLVGQSEWGDGVFAFPGILDVETDDAIFVDFALEWKFPVLHI